MRTVKQIKEEINILHKEIQEIQDKCFHPRQEAVSHMAYGYGMEADYWLSITCLDCEKKWMEDDR